jgi:septum formation protein
MITKQLPLEIVLASGSPRRRELLSQAGVRFGVVVPNTDETPIEGESPQEMVERLALEKAEAIASSNQAAYVIGADTTVYIDQQALGKPSSELEACQMLAKIQGRAHQVWGGVAVVCREARVRQVWSHSTQVTMRPMDQATIEAYVATGEPLDKAGSYAIQGIGLQFVDQIDGSYSNVVGLNIASLMTKLRELGCL